MPARSHSKFHRSTERLLRFRNFQFLSFAATTAGGTKRLILIGVLSISLAAYWSGSSRLSDESGAQAIAGVPNSAASGAIRRSPQPYVRKFASLMPGEPGGIADFPKSRDHQEPVAVPSTAGRPGATDFSATAWSAVLRELADRDLTRLYRSLWQVLEIEDSSESAFQAFVLATLDRFEAHAPGEVLAALIQDAPNSDFRRRALNLLGEASQELLVKDLLAAVESSDASVRRSGLAYFDELDVAAMLDATASAAHDPDPAVRLAALATLEEMSEFSPVWEVAETLLADADSQVRLRALELLTYGDPQTAIVWLVLALQDPDPLISERAEALLAELDAGPS
jgi:hypothetical protein